MDPHALQMILTSIADVKEECKGIREDLKEHAEKDAAYWQKIDQAEGQIKLLKLFGGTVSGGSILAWLYTHFGKP